MKRMTATLIAGLLVLAPALAADEKAKETEKSKSDKDKEESLSFTNEDLARRYGGDEEKKPAPETSQSVPSSEQPSTDKPGTDEASALEKLFADRDSRKEKVGMIAEAEAAVAAARERVTQLEKKKLAVVNPFLARPAAPEDAADAERWKKMNGAERVAASNSELEEARKALAEAVSALASARRN